MAIYYVGELNRKYAKLNLLQLKSYQIIQYTVIYYVVFTYLYDINDYINNIICLDYYNIM